MPKQERIRTLDAAGVSSREIAARLRVSRNTVAKYVNQEDFSPSPQTLQVSSLVDTYAHIVEEWLTDDLQQPRKQRHTGRRVYDRLVIEHGFAGSYATVQRWVKRWRQARLIPGDGFIELEWEPGCAQADFGEAAAIIQGERVTIHMLVVTWPHSNARYAVVLPGETSECVCEGLRTIFEHVGRVPTRIVFDNATGVGKRMGKEVTTTKLFTAFKLHYRFTAEFTNPYSGNEKGNVENAVGFIRRNALVPVPHVESFMGLTDYLLTTCDGLLPEQHYRKSATVQSLFTLDMEVMRHLPGVRFDACTWLDRRVDKVGNIEVSGVKYYVGDAYNGQRVHVGLRAFAVEARNLAG
jgi:transposase